MKCLLCGRPMRKKMITDTEFQYFGAGCVLYIASVDWLHCPAGRVPIKKMVISNWCDNKINLMYFNANRMEGIECVFHEFDKIGEFLYKGFKI